MTEEEVKSVEIQAVAAPETNSEAQAQQPVESADQTENSKEYNFSKLREKAEKAEKKSAELERRLRELSEQVEKSTSRATPPPEEEDDLSKLDPEDILTVKQAYKLSEIQATKIFQETLEQREKSALPEKVRTQFSDFDSVMTEENINKLENDEPGLALACAKAPNPWEATYKILKKFIVPVKEELSARGDMKLKENMSKPASSNAAGRVTPLSNSNLWSEASRDELYKEMMQAARQSH
jgi:hypothetical protein